MKMYEQISKVSFGRLMGELESDGKIECDVIGCESLAICLVGCGQGHPSCERHAQGEDYIFPLGDEEDNARNIR